jgi:hypothetical protein
MRGFSPGVARHPSGLVITRRSRAICSFFAPRRPTADRLSPPSPRRSPLRLCLCLLSRGIAEGSALSSHRDDGGAPSKRSLGGILSLPAVIPTGAATLASRAAKAEGFVAPPLLPTERQAIVGHRSVWLLPIWNSKMGYFPIWKISFPPQKMFLPFLTCSCSDAYSCRGGRRRDGAGIALSHSDRPSTS